MSAGAALRLGSGHAAAITQVFEPDEMLPAPGKGALAVECRRDLISETGASCPAW